MDPASRTQLATACAGHDGAVGGRAGAPSVSIKSRARTAPRVCWSIRDVECARVESLRRAQHALQTEDLMGCLERLAELRPEQGIEPPTAGALHAALAACWERRCLLRAG